jgi:integrase
MASTPRLEKTRTPGVFKRGNRYVVVYRDRGGRQRKRFCRTLAEAKDCKAALRTDLRRGEYRELSSVTLADYADEWLQTYTGRTSRGVGEGTLADYRGALDRDILPVLGRLRLVDIEPRDVKRLGATLAGRGLKRSSVTKTMAPLKALLATAVEDGLIRSSPAAGVRLAAPVDQGEDEPAAKALAEPELAALLVALPAEWRLFFRFLFESGLRIGEAIELRYSDLEGDWLRVDRRFYRGAVGLPKGRKRRRVGLSHEMATQLWDRRKTTRAKADELVFAAERGGRIDPSNVMSRVLKPAARRAGIGGWVGFHTLRHTCATALFRRGWNAVQVQRFLGHTDPGFTLRAYVHLLDEDLPRPDFSAVEGNGRATRAAETTRNAFGVGADELAEGAGGTSDQPRQHEVVVLNS